MHAGLRIEECPAFIEFSRGDECLDLDRDALDLYKLPSEIKT